MSNIFGYHHMPITGSVLTGQQRYDGTVSVYLKDQPSLDRSVLVRPRHGRWSANVGGQHPRNAAMFDTRDQAIAAAHEYLGTL